MTFWSTSSNLQPDRRTGTGRIWSDFNPGCAHAFGLAGMAGNVLSSGPVFSFSSFPYVAGGFEAGPAVGDPVGSSSCRTGDRSAVEQPQTKSTIAAGNRFTVFMPPAG
ncbi:hypothetical protein [Nonomuraea sp. NPDC050691]|uniref:hypothetical protein n=1 Tax=Nonomuraea sp. NPDC050691 TaxID=3155661 RepID=UPI0033E1FCFB